ncbi:glutamine synthetase [Streptomyces roseirectus]|uniref:Glutamine synthetase n=1 Tax=Streptomyces roseirectus TaxID=2768066 RepID=A0A7H0I5P7_9ACTN|nr:glutamine synthetase family protein [Streptomyces roseirectus]QNP68113.1 glutamine synthetase [Streptomyces roseirectus]
MDIDDFLNAPGRADGIGHARKLIDLLGIEYIYVQYVTVTGRVVGKGIPAAHWEDVAGRGVQLVYGSTANVATDRAGHYLGHGPEASELLALPDPDTFAQLPWDGRIARVFARLFRNRDEETDPGATLDADCRTNLARLQAAFTERHGTHLRIGTEPEMLWLRREKGELVGVTKPHCYHIDQFEELREVTLRSVAYGRALGLDMIQGDHEDAPGQLELNFAHDDPLRTADRLITYRQICRQVARELGLVACFLPKPFQGYPGCGCHHNLSLWDGGHDEERDLGTSTCAPGVRTHLTGGTNTFRTADGASRRHTIGGIVAHLPALTALACPTVNSYRRLRDSGLWAPVTAHWGHQNRTCAVRVSAPDRIEFRVADSLTNPYLMAAGLLAAVDDGLTRRLDAGPPLAASAYDTPGPRLPGDLGTALAALDADDVVRAALPGRLYSTYTALKGDEWDRFLATTTAWDFDTYLDHTP